MILSAILLGLALIHGILIIATNDTLEAKEIGDRVITQSLLLGATLSTLIYCVSLFIPTTL